MITIGQAQAELGYLLDENEGEAFCLLGMLQTIKIGRDDTAGLYGLIEIVVPAGIGSPWHVHPEEDEWFYVLEGEMTFWVANTRLSLKAGSFAFGPKGVSAHVLRRGLRSEGTRRLRADAVRGTPERSRRAGPRTRPAATARSSPGHGAAHRDREAKRFGDPRPARPPSRVLAHRDQEHAPAGARGSCANSSNDELESRVLTIEPYRQHLSIVERHGSCPLTLPV